MYVVKDQWRSAQRHPEGTFLALPASTPGLPRYLWHEDVALSNGATDDIVKIGHHLSRAQTAFILFSTFLELRPVSAAHDVQTSINSRLEIRISKSKTPV
jgi:hypothetical protein